MGSPPIRGSAARTLSHLSRPEAQPKKAPAPEAPVKGWAPREPQRRVATATTFGAAVAPAPQPAPRALADAQAALSFSWKDWSVSTTDISLVHRSLEGLSMSDYADALQQLDQGGLLERYVGAMDPQQRAAFLDQAMRKDALGCIAGEKAKGPFDPPATPRLYIQSGTLPKALRDAVHLGNLEAATGYDNAYRGYIDRYAAGVMEQPDAAGIRRLGPPAEHVALEEPGLEKTNPDFPNFIDDWASKARLAPSETRGWSAISNRMDDLTGQVRPGSFWLQAEVEVVKKDGPLARGTGFNLTVRDYGQVELAGKKSLGLEGDAGVFSGGAKVELEAGVKLQRNTHPHVEKEASVKVTAQVGSKHGPSVGVEAGTEGGRELRLNLDEHLGSYSKGNLKEATLEGGLRLKKELSKTYELEGKLGLGMKAISEEEVANALDPENPGFFAEPPERAAKVPWAALSERAQARYRAQGYDEKNWL